MGDDGEFSARALPQDKTTREEGMRLRTRMTLMQVVTVVAAIVALCWVFVMQIRQYARTEMETYRRETLAEEKQQLKDFVQMAAGTIDSYYQRSQDVEGLKMAKLDDLKRVVDAVYGQVAVYYEANKDRLPKDELIRGVSAIVTPARYDGENYLWVHDLDNVMLVHPSASLVGRDLSDLKDKKGNRMIHAMTEIAARDGAGMSSYWWAKPGETEAKLKISYVRLLPDAGWVIGTGAWLEDITAEMQAEALAQVAKMRLTDGKLILDQRHDPAHGHASHQARTGRPGPERVQGPQGQAPVQGHGRGGPRGGRGVRGLHLGQAGRGRRLSQALLCQALQAVGLDRGHGRVHRQHRRGRGRQAGRPGPDRALHDLHGHGHLPAARPDGRPGRVLRLPFRDPTPSGASPTTSRPSRRRCPAAT